MLAGGKLVLTVGICYFLGYGLVKPFALRLLSDYPTMLQENVAMLTGMGLYTAFNYLEKRFFAFKADDK